MIYEVSVFEMENLLKYIYLLRENLKNKRGKNEYRANKI